MKKVLSVLLAASMVMGMSVSAFAAKYSPVEADPKKVIEITEDNVAWGNAYHWSNDEYVAKAGVDSTDDFALEEGDEIFFEILVDGERVDALPSNWTLKINNAEYVEDAKFVLYEGELFVKVTLADDFDAKDLTREDKNEAVEFWMYIKDTKHNKMETEKATIHFGMAKYAKVTLTKDMIADVVDVEEDTIYKLAKGLKSQIVVFNFDGVLVKVKMFEGDEYLVKPSDAFKWNKTLAKKYDTDVDVLTFNTELDVREVIFESAKDNKQVVAVVDGDLVAVESEFVSKYEIIKGVELVKGYVADVDANAGAYALVSADLEIEAEEVEVEAEKANPETGAADFVGAAVAMAVVSVAAAGALALKK